MTIKLAVLSVAKHTNRMTQALKDHAGDKLEVVLHLGGENSHFKVSSIGRIKDKLGTEGHLMEDRAYSGAARPLILSRDFYRNRDLVTDHFYRMSDSYNTKSHPLKTLNDYHDYYQVIADTLADELVDRGVTHCLFFNVPHLAYDTMLYQVAKALDLQVVILVQSLFPNLVFSMNDFNDIGNFADNPDAQPYGIEKGSKPDLFYMKGIKQEHEDGGRVTAKAMMNLASFLIRKRPAKALNPVYLWKTISHMQKVYGSLPKWRDPYARFFHEDSLAYFDYLAGYEDQDVDLSGDFVYFPLQLQPEMTTSTLGDRFCDQAYAIERLSEILPAGVRLLVKENPKQGAYMRGPLFFHRLNRIPSVTLLPSWADTHALTDGAKFVASITGTVGWEAIRNGKPALVFGKAWYRNFPGVHEFSDDLTYEEIAHTKIDHEALEQAVGALISRGHPCVTDRNFIPLVDNYSEPKNDQFLAEVILGLLEKRLSPTWVPSAK